MRASSQLRLLAGVSQPGRRQGAEAILGIVPEGGWD
jgi:hypothetical protein